MITSAEIEATSNDLLYGGEGNDTIIGGEGTTAGTDFDTLDLSATTTGLTVDLTSPIAESGTFTDGVSTANFVEIENIVLGGGRDTVVLADSSGADTVNAFDLTDSGDGTTNDQLNVSGLTGDAILTSPGGENNTLVGVLSSQVDSFTELDSMGIPAVGSVDGTAGADTIDGGAGDDTVEALNNFSWPTFLIDNDDGNDVLIGYEGISDNVDRLMFDASTSTDGVTVTFTAGQCGEFWANDGRYL